ncbi:MAG: NnrU family protein [Hyphomicrobiales bacterium]|nr:NnrU family protein [Hyphomicrobiales bacterium]
MLLLILGLVIFLGCHALSMARGPRARLVEQFGASGFRGLYTAVSLLGFVLIIYGFGAYRAGAWVNVWHPPVWTKHLALLLNLPIFILLAATNSGGRIHAAVKHPMLLAVKIWATAHLLANGDLGGILLFGGFLIWAVLARISLKRRENVKLPVAPAGFTQRDWIAIGAGLVLWFVFARWLHPLLIGVAVWPGR